MAKKENQEIEPSLSEMEVDYEQGLVKSLKIMQKLDKLGILDVVDGILSDESTISAVFGFLTSDNALKILQNKDTLLKLLGMLSDDEKINTINRIMGLITELNKKGLLDPVEGILSDDQSFSAIMSLLSNDLTLNILQNFNTITKSLGSLDLSKMPKYTNLIKSIEKAYDEETPEPVKGIGGTLKAIHDPDAQEGLGIIFAILRSIGKNNKTDFKSGSDGKN